MENFICEYIDLFRKQMVEDLKELINIPSISSDKDRLNDAVSWIVVKAKSFGLDVKTVLDNQICLIELGTGEETIGILTHVDVVDGGSAEDWHTNPFIAEEKDGKIYGRGAIDDKGPLLACLYAMKAIKEKGVAFTKKIQMIIGTQEEVDWTDMEEYVENYPTPDYSFTPDGEFPITNIEKGYMDVELCFKNDFYPAKEKKQVEIISIVGGTVINMIPAKCVAMVLGNDEEIFRMVGKFNQENKQELIAASKIGKKIEIVATGHSVHSCFPARGINAISILCQFMSRLPLYGNERGNAVMFINHMLSNSEDLRELGIENKEEFINGEFIHKTVASPTIVTAKGNHVILDINFRPAYGIASKDIEGCFEKYKDKYSYSIDLKEAMEAIYVSRDCKFLEKLAKAYEEVSGLKNEFMLAYGCSYAMAMPNTVAFGPIFPGEEDCCHEANEYISVENLVKMAKIYGTSLEKIVFNAETFK